MLNKIGEHVSNKKVIYVLVVALAVLVSAAAINNFWDMLARFGWASPAPTIAKTINISADGKVTVSPDTAVISFSVVTDGQTAEEVQQKNTLAMNKVTDYIKSQGVEAKDIKTSNYNLYPKYDYINGKQTAAGYSLSQTLEVKIRDLTKVGTILTGAIARGANQVSGVQYTVDNPDTYQAQARAEAFKKANDKAKELVKEAGVSLGRVVTFSESVSGGPPIYYDKAYGIGGGGMASAPAPDIQQGSQDITVIVNVTYEIR